jgi:hypothetical protein
VTRGGTGALALGLLLTLPPAAGATEGPEQQPISVSLRGPFGTVVGGDPATPAVAAPDGRALDAWAREAVLELTVDPTLPPDAAVSVSASARPDGASVTLPLEDGHWVTAPDRAGEYLLVATIEGADLEASEHAWLLAVPDRPGDFETWLQRPPIEALARSSTGSVMGERGHGCLVDLCQDVGYRPPAETLPPLTVPVGEPVSLELDDGSAMVRWQGRLEPLPGTDSETRLARATFDEPVAELVLTGLEPDREGEWLLELRTDYDRERGWQWYLFRLVAE